MIFRLVTSKDPSVAASWLAGTFGAFRVKWIELALDDSNDVECLLEFSGPDGVYADWIAKRAAFLSSGTVKLEFVK